MATFLEEQEKELYETTRTMRKLILIENWEDLGLNSKQRKHFVKFYYDILDDVGLIEGLNKFKKKKYA